MGIKIKCPKCGNVWEYKGNKKVKCICTDCKLPVLILENKVIDNPFMSE